MISFWPLIASADNDLQLQMGDSASIYSEKAYRKDGGTYFEAVGNVVISAGKDTLYGESASINTKTGKVIIEGSVRFIGQSVTLYGSKITYDMQSKQLEMKNARLITPDFSVVSAYILKKSDTQFYATEAEFTTCRDCTESWQVFGKEINLEVGAYVKIRHALMKVKGVDVLYFPYLILPMKNNRESGLLFPNVTTQNEEGLAYKQPIFWNISPHEDATVTPTFMSRRGQGMDLQYRKVLGEKTWFEFNNKMAYDKVYLPGTKDNNDSGGQFFRHFFELESHYQKSLNGNHHLRVLGTKDLDFIRDFQYYTRDFDTTTDLGLVYTGEQRFDEFTIGLETQYKRNQLISNPLEFDSSYVQILPKLNFSLLPQFIWQRQGRYFSKFIIGLEGDVTQFKQNRIDEDEKLRNAVRLNVDPYAELNLLNFGPIMLKTKYAVDYQEYQFTDEEEVPFYKNTGLVSTELSFSFDRIFGLAYEEKYNVDELYEKDLRKISKRQDEKAKNALSKKVIGKLPKLEKARTKEVITVKKNSYRHSQEFKFIHHQLVHDSENGNERFFNQIQEENGWFDYEDAIKSDILNLNSDEARTRIPINNTLELQWNNNLIRKSTKAYNYLVDHKYLKDNFSYTKLGHFNISQGFLLEGENETFKDSLTRLKLDAFYTTSTWSSRLIDYYNHQSNDHILTMSGSKRFDSVNLLAQYNFNSYSSLKTLKTGFQIRPIDAFGFSILKEHNMELDENIASIYQVDLMPNNNCWVFNFSYEDNVNFQRFNVNFLFNFGDETVKDFKNSFFGFNRLQ